MSTINRIEVTNFLNLNGEGESEPWEPRYRAVLFNFRGQSTALNMTNGVGKTSNVEAWLALLTRDPLLISRSRLKMAPERDGYYSHVRIELLVPASGSTSTDDLFVMDGGQSPGRETWVFGMYGYRSAGSVYFYYYRGTLEQVPVARYAPVALLPNQAFRDALKNAPNARHNPVREDWLAELDLHVSNAAMRRQGEYQKRGGGDKSAELFALKSRPGERYDVTFFYEVIAPELLAGLMDREGEEGEHQLEDTVLNAVMDVVRTRHNTQRKRAELDRVEQVLGALDQAAERARTAQGAQAGFDAQAGRMARAVALLADLAVDRPLAGIPRAPEATGLLGRLQAQVLIEPGERLYRISDAGLALLTAESAQALNGRAQRSGCPGRRSNQVILVPAPGWESGDGRKPARPTGYGPADARALVEAAPRWAEGLTRAAALDLLDDLDGWVLRHEAHRNPFRTRRNELEYDLDQARRDLTEAELGRTRADHELAGLRDQKTRMEADEAAYRDLQSSGLFSPAELEHPADLAQEVQREHREADRARQSFLEEKARVDAYLPQWQAFQRSYPDADDPEPVHLRHLEEERAAEAGLKEVRRERAQAQAEAVSLAGEIRAGEKALESSRGLMQRFERLDPDLARYACEFGDTPPEGLDTRVHQEKIQAETELDQLRNDMAGLHSQVDDLTAFRRQVGQQAPADWLAARERERDELLGRQGNLKRERAELTRRRRDLDRDPVAAGAAAREALAALEAAGIPHQPLHRALDALELDPARRRALLSCLSALLFAPVAPDPAAAQAAAECLAERDAQVPVFMADALAAFARGADLAEGPGPGFYRGLIAGVTTHAVECLLDPGLVARERERLDDLIAKAAEEAGRIEARLRATGDDAPLTRLARRAQAAAEADAPAALARARARRGELTEALPALVRRASDEMLAAIRAAQELARLGGPERRAALGLDLDRQSLLLAELQERDALLRERLETLAADELQAQTRLAACRAFPAHDARALR